MSYSINVTNLPIVLAGPILRRVTPNSVSVWIALKEDIAVKLLVKKVDNIVVFQSTIAEHPVKLGNNLYVIVISASGTNLQEGQIYKYDVEFELSPVKTLKSVGILGSIADASIVSYAPYDLPTFSIPPTNLNKLRIIHGSCRKPHGENYDALQALDTILKGSVRSANSRPHYLFLTGDQIYSDDVSPILLYMIKKASSQITVWVENIQGLNNDFVVSNRTDIIKNSDFTVDKECSSNHLMKLCEFYLMYLFAWSDILWNNTLPTFEEVHSGATKTFISYEPVGKGELTRERIVQNPLYTQYKLDNFRITFFKNSLSKIRKSLANVPVYMILDDHEITDDIYLNYKWCEKVLGVNNSGGNSSGKRIIQNGMTAYAIFQSWGNTPDRFADITPETAGRKLLNCVKDIAANSSIQSTWDAIANIVLPKLNNANRSLENNPNSLIWHYKIDWWPKHEIIILDTRTNRSYPNNMEGFAQLISSASVNQQLPTLFSKELPILISPAPFIGAPNIEDLILNLPGSKEGKDMEAWGYNEFAFEHFLARLGDKLPIINNDSHKGKIIILSGDVHYGFSIRLQVWADKLYNSTQSIKKANYSVIQLTSSSLKNESIEPYQHGPLHWHSKGFKNLINQRNTFVYTCNPNYMSPGRLERFKGIYNDRLNSAFFSFYFPPIEWKYRVDPIIAQQVASSDYYDPDSGNSIYDEDRRMQPTPYSPRLTGTEISKLNSYLGSLSNHKEYATKWGDGKEIVGRNNLGDITFNWPVDENNRAVIQRIWWGLQEGNGYKFKVPFPLSKFVVPLGLNIPDFPEPNII